MASKYRKEELIRLVHIMEGALEQALDCLNDETPEDCTRELAKAETIERIKDALDGK